MLFVLLSSIFNQTITPREVFIEDTGCCAIREGFQRLVLMKTTLNMDPAHFHLMNVTTVMSRRPEKRVRPTTWMESLKCCLS